MRIGFAGNLSAGPEYEGVRSTHGGGRRPRQRWDLKPGLTLRYSGGGAPIWPQALEDPPSQADLMPL